MPSGRASSWPLVGRGEELAAIEHSRSAGDGAVVVIGPAGVGKSRLVREALTVAEHAGAVTRWVQATASAAYVGLGAFAGVIPDSVRAEDPLERLRASADALAALGNPERLVLGIDDAQLLDPVSAALVLALTLSETVFVVMTVRSGEPCPDAIASMWKDDGATRLELEALSRDETETLAERIAGGPIEQSARRWIYETSLGNALYVRELALGALTGGALTEVHGLWRMPARPPVSATLTELITVRMTGLSPSESQTLELLALGEPLRVSEVVALVGADALTVVEARGLVTVGDGSNEADVALAHPLYGEAIRSGLPAFKARQTRLMLVQTVQARSDPHAQDPLRIARWLLDSGEAMPTEALLEAAAAANLAGDPELGVQLAEQAVQAGGGIRAALLLARGLTIQSHHRRAAAVLDAAEAQIETQAEAIEYLEQQATVLHFGLRRSEDLRALLDRAAAWWEGPEWEQRVAPLRLIAIRGETPALAAADTSQIFGDEHADADVRHRIAPMHAGNLFFSGRVREAYQLARSIRPSVPLRDLTDELAFMLWSAISIESGEGWEELGEWATAALSDGVRLGDRAAAGRGALSLGGLRFSQGRFIDAGRWLAEAELQLERHDAGGLLAITNTMQVGVACFTSNLNAIEPALQRCRAAVGETEPLPNQLPYFVRAQAWAVAALGDPPRAQTMLLKAADQLADTPIYAARLTYEALRAGAPAQRLAPKLGALSERCDARLTAAYAAHAKALAAADGAALTIVVDEMQSIGAVRYATEAAAHAASAFARAGREDSARRTAVRCYELHAQGQGGSLPLIEGIDTADTALTSRERQLVDLASRGLSNAQIADRLILSIRTVESHLYRAMGKLGVDNRQDL
jgi:DNA-binding CsgD family transcriptional regulator